MKFDHEAIKHQDASFHHSHSHAETSSHSLGHHLLSVEDLSVSFRLYDPAYPGFIGVPKIDIPILDGLTLSIHRGEMLALIGPSGAGKSVLADALIGIYEPNASVRGRIWYDGVRQDVKSLALLRRHRIALIPQSLQSLDPLMTVGAYFKRRQALHESETSTKSIAQWLEEFELSPTVLKRYPSELSGGMARRVLAIGALLTTPELLIADEPTPGLDEHLAIIMLDHLREVADRGGGVLLITHDLSLGLRQADRVAVLHRGTVVEETAVEAFESPDRLRDSFTRQLWYALPEHDFAVYDDCSVASSSASGDFSHLTTEVHRENSHA